MKRIFQDNITRPIRGIITRNFGPARVLIPFIGLSLLVVIAALFRENLIAATQRVRKNETVATRLKQYGTAARGRLRPFFSKAAISYPPKSVIFVAIKEERLLQVYASDVKEHFSFIRSYPVLAASGILGPKLREGDAQVPEGIYRIDSLNPNSQFHLSLRLNYPNEFDREQARKEGRTGLGGDIMIHGDAVSIGCLAVGDEAAEDLFVLAADAGLQNISALLTPVDFRKGKTVPKAVPKPVWTDSLYAAIKAKLQLLPPENPK